MSLSLLHAVQIMTDGKEALCQKLQSGQATLSNTRAAAWLGYGVDCTLSVTEQLVDRFLPPHEEKIEEDDEEEEKEEEERPVEAVKPKSSRFGLRLRMRLGRKKKNKKKEDSSESMISESEEEGEWKEDKSPYSLSLSPSLLSSPSLFFPSNTLPISLGFSPLPSLPSS